MSEGFDAGYAQAIKDVVEALKRKDPHGPAHEGMPATFIVREFSAPSPVDNTPNGEKAG